MLNQFLNVFNECTFISERAFYMLCIAEYRKKKDKRRAFALHRKDQDVDAHSAVLSLCHLQTYFYFPGKGVLG